MGFYEILEKEAQAWASELPLYDPFLFRAIITPKERAKYEGFKYAILGIIKEIEELKGMYKVEIEKCKMKNEVYKIFSKKFINNGVESYGFYTYISIIVEGEENLGPQVRGLKVYFNRDNVDTSEFKNGGTVLVAKDKVKKPGIYKLVNGKYPYIWIDEIVDFVGD